MKKTSKPPKPAVRCTSVMEGLEAVRMRLRKLRVRLGEEENGPNYLDVFDAEELIEKCQNRMRSRSSNVRDERPPLASGTDPAPRSGISRSCARSPAGTVVRSIALLAIYFFLNSLGSIFAGNAGVGSNVGESEHDGDISIRRIKMNVSLPASLDDFRLDGMHMSPNFQSGLDRCLSHLGVQRAFSRNLGKDRGYQGSYGSTGKSGGYDGEEKFHILIVAVLIGGVAGVLGCPIGVWIARYFFANVRDEVSRTAGGRGAKEEKL